MLRVEQQSRDAAEALTNISKVAPDNAFAEVLDAPAAHEDGISTSEEEGAGTLPENAPAVPGESAAAAPAPQGGGEQHDQTQVPEQAHSSETAPELGGQ